MFGRRRKSDKLPAEITLTAATSSIAAEPSVMAQLHSRSHGISPTHKVLLAQSLASRPVEGTIVLLQALPQRGSAGASQLGGGYARRGGPHPGPTAQGQTLEDQLDAALAGSGLTIERLVELFASQGWPHEVRGDTLLTVAEGIPLLFIVDEEKGILHLLLPVAPGRGQQGYVPVRPEAEMSAAVYLLTVNYRLPYGAFTRDHRDGEIRFESSLLVADAALTAEQVARMMVFAIAALATQVPVIFGLLRGELSLKQALARLDAESRPSEIQIA